MKTGRTTISRLTKLIALICGLAVSPLAAQELDPPLVDVSRSQAASGNVGDLIEQQSQLIQQQQSKLEELEDSLNELSDSVSDEKSTSIFGYDSGFVFADSKTKLDKSDTDYRMRIGSWGQMRHNFFDSDGPNADQNDFDIERVRLVFNGNAFGKNFEYFFQLDGDSDASETIDLLDYYVTYDFGRELLGAPSKRLRLRFGKWKIGFNRAREESGAKMQFSDRSMASVLFDFDRSLGLGILGTEGPFDWQLTLANGIDTGGFRPSRAGQLDRNFAVATRANLVLWGDWGSDGHADLDCRAKPAVRVGGGYTYSQRELEGQREFDFPRVIDSGAALSSILPLGIESYDQQMFAADINAKYRGWSVIFEYYWRSFQDIVPATVSDQGFWLETGYFIRPKFQVLGRWSRADGNSGTLGGVDESADEVAMGGVYYIKGHNLKLTFDATHLNGAPISDSALNIRPGDAGMLYRTQFQWKF